jgi:transcriptional regulator with XRE-family HTH domain
MNYSTVLIDAVKEKLNLPSDNQAAKAIGIERTFLSNIRAGRRNLPPEQIVIAAELAGIDPGIALLRRYKETIDDFKVRAHLEKIEEEIQGLKDAS